ncbi:hypothetical protein, partial [Leucobacter sp. G161]|uniref:hypothetical protein n=1 Tax=Leucobacter sp. G161 TaxID=663704 RepID=UPI0009FB2592
WGSVSRPPGQKLPKLTNKQEREAYAVATVRDNGNESGLGICQRCSRYGPCDRDHRQNRTAWNTTPANLQLLGGAFGCGCHIWKTENPAEAIQAGFSVPSWADPLEWPAWRHGAGWVLSYDAPVEGLWWRPISDQEARALMEGKEEHRDP